LAEISGALKAPTAAEVSAIEVSRFKPTLKVGEHNRVAHASPPKQSSKPPKLKYEAP